MNFSEKLIRLRKREGVSQEELASYLEVSRQAVSRWEQGTALPDAGNLLKLRQRFGVSVDWLLEDAKGWGFQTVAQQKAIQPCYHPLWRRSAGRCGHRAADINCREQGRENSQKQQSKG